MALSTGGQELAGRTRSLVASTFLLVGAVLPAAALLYLRFSPAFFTARGHALYSVLLVVMPLATFLLAIFLWQARFKIQELETRQAEAALDPLSSLPNRLFFDRLLQNAIAQSKPEAPIALLAIDIDRFKSVNDTHGHQAGDRLIVGIVERIKRIIRDGDCLARVGGDEFALMLINTGGIAQCAAVARRVQDAMVAQFDIGRAQINATLSIGIALCPQDGDTVSKLTQAADLALYRAKDEGRNRFAFFDRTMEQKLRLGMTIEDDLRAAILADKLTIVYQPLVSACGTRTIGLEALVRWNHPEFGFMPPEAFIPVAESRGLIVPLGEWVLRRACQDAKRWPGLRMAVNVSPVQFRQRGFVENVRAIIEASGVDPARLDLELTEGVVIQDADQAENVIMDLRALGLRMGLDDFGSGYSSLIYLRRFAFDKIKIDRAFLESMEPSGEGGIILESIISLGHTLGLTVTAEGVEYKEQLEFLQQLGCDEMQGYYFAAPLSVEEVDMRISLETWTAQDQAKQDQTTQDRTTPDSLEQSRSAA